jgi:hypothetical protein
MSKYSIRYLDEFGCAVQTAFGVFDGDETAERHALVTIGSNASIEVWKHSLDPDQDQCRVLATRGARWLGVRTRQPTRLS